ncbi:hypothetical protein C6P40_003505 [Pichia californica]|uniref:UBC core domain-containing protein n=1 Tax=Pichia californica TaxID=460514 RepID=A0A9P6WQ57_9ASCO|nr:hypothetical protein C6P42_004755 [[Candida] californica]KAG0691254.1 hypothetical protein C6P40_003505 [[Candida] californica]
MSAAKILWKEFRDITHPKTGLKQVHVQLPDDNIFLWDVSLIIVDPQSDYNGAYLKGQLTFPSNYPFSPPNFKFTPAIFHPNVYTDGKLCISILHTADEQNSDEPANFTWSPAQNVESVLLSIISLLEDPNINSPANVEASICYRKQKNAYKEKVLQDVEKSRSLMPADVVLPSIEDIINTKKGDENEEENEEDWWEDDFYYDDEEEYCDENVEEEDED